MLSCSGTIGRSCVIETNEKFWFVRSAAFLKPMISGHYLSYCLRSPLLQTQMDDKKTMTAQANLFQGKIKQLLIPVASKLEQEEAVSQITKSLAALETVEKHHDGQTSTLVQLTQSLLQKAFRGDLVPQDPTDEPASTLLARIQAEREQNKLKLKSKKKK